MLLYQVRVEPLGFAADRVQLLAGVAHVVQHVRGARRGVAHAGRGRVRAHARSLPPRHRVVVRGRQRVHQEVLELLCVLTGQVAQRLKKTLVRVSVVAARVLLQLLQGVHKHRRHLRRLNRRFKAHASGNGAELVERLRHGADRVPGAAALRRPVLVDRAKQFFRVPLVWCLRALLQGATRVRGSRCQRLAPFRHFGLLRLFAILPEHAVGVVHELDLQRIANRVLLNLRVVARLSFPLRAGHHGTARRLLGRGAVRRGVAYVFPDLHVLRPAGISVEDDMERPACIEVFRQ